MQSGASFLWLQSPVAAWRPLPLGSTVCLRLLGPFCPHFTTKGVSMTISLFPELVPVEELEQPLERKTIVILSLGMGVESVAILVRWIMEPETRPCPLEDLIVITAMVGDEYDDT